MTADGLGILFGAFGSALAFVLGLLLALLKHTVDAKDKATAKEFAEHKALIDANTAAFHRVDGERIRAEETVKALKFSVDEMRGSMVQRNEWLAHRDSVDQRLGEIVHKLDVAFARQHADDRRASSHDG